MGMGMPQGMSPPALRPMQGMGLPSYGVGQQPARLGGGMGASYGGMPPPMQTGGGDPMMPMQGNPDMQPGSGFGGPDTQPGGGFGGPDGPPDVAGMPDGQPGGAYGGPPTLKPQQVSAPMSTQTVAPGADPAMVLRRSLMLR